MSAITVAVNFLSKGLESVRAAGKRLLEDQAKSKEAAKQLQAQQIAVAAAYAYTSAKIMGYVRAGLAGTTMGERIATNFQFLNREIAQLFLPAIEKANRGLEKVVLWFRSLDGEQQKAIGKWSAIAVGMLGVLTIGPKVAGAFGMIAKVMGAGFATAPFLSIVAALGMTIARSEKLRDQFKETFGPAIEKLKEPAMKFFEAMSTAIAAAMPLVEQLASLFLTAFGKVFELFVQGLVPILEDLTDLLNSSAGRWIAFGAIILIMVPKIVTAVKMLTMAFTTMKGAMFFGIPLILGLFSSMSGGSKETKNHLADINDLLAGVRKGTITTEEAKKTAKERSGDKASQAELELAQKLVDLIASTKGIKDVSLEEALKILRENKLDEIMSDMTGMQKLAGSTNIMNMRGVVDDFSKLNKEQTDAVKQQEAAIDVAAGKKGPARSELIKSGGQFEDPRETFKRLQSASLKTDIPQRQLTTLEEIRDSINPLAGLMAKMAEKPTGAAE